FHSVTTKRPSDISFGYSTDNALENGNSFNPVPKITANADSTSTSTISGPVTTEEKAQKKNDVKARSMLLMTLPNLEQIQEDDLEEMDLKWPRNQNSLRKTVIVKDTSSKAMVAIDGAGFDWSYLGDDDVPTNMAHMAFSDLEIKIDNFKNASKSLNKLIGSQIIDNSKTGLGFTSYNVVAPTPTGLFAPPTIDLSSSGLEEFKQPEFKSYEPRGSKSVCVDTSNVIKKVSDTLIIGDWVFDCDEDESEEVVVISEKV
nr:hypothetical protein [Tanacetum cinerariifolium]